MSTFLGQFGHSIGSTFGNSIGNSIGQTLHTAAPEELRVGSHHVLVREKVAEGGFGVIELVVDTHTQQKEMILKRCNVDRPEVFDIVKKEVNILQKFKGPYVVNLIDNDVAMKNSSREAYILLEFCPGGHLLHRLNERHGQPLPAESVYRIFGQILLGMKALHEHRPPIIHRDIKLENTLFGTDGKVRLCDFGSCLESPIPLRNVEERNKAEESIGKETTQMYRAPEMVDLYMRNQLTEKTDIWALGCVFFALSYLKHPFQDAGSLGILAGKYVLPQNGTISEDAVIVLKRMLDIDPEARPSILDLLLAIREVAKGAPLPPFELSAEALQRRAERLAADEVRKSKAKKKPVANPIDTKRAAPPSVNSVAAKRLAAKRGDNFVTSAAPVAHGGGASEASFEDDLFGSTTSSSAVNDFQFSSGNADEFQAEDAGFDPFADSSTSAKHSESAFVADDWGATAAPASSAKTNVRKPSFSMDDDHDAFAPSIAVATTQEFDPFADPPATGGHGASQTTATKESFDPFAQPSDASHLDFDNNDDGFEPTKPVKSVAVSLFGGVDEDDTPPPPAPPTTAVKPSRPSFTATTPAAAAAAAVDTSGFDMFDSHAPSVSQTPAIVASPAPTPAAAAAARPSVTSLINNDDDDAFFAPTSTTTTTVQSGRSSFTATTNPNNNSTSTNSAHHLQDLLFASNTSSNTSSSGSSAVSAPSAFDMLPTTPLQPARASFTSTPSTTNDLLDVPVHHTSSSSSSSSSFAATTPSGKGSVDVLSLYDMPKAEAPLKPMRAGAVGTGLGGLGGDVLPPPQALGYAPNRAMQGGVGGLGGGRPMPQAPMGGYMQSSSSSHHQHQHQHQMMMRPMNSSNSSGSSMSMSMSSPSPYQPIARNNPSTMGMNNSMKTSGAYRPANADPFDSLNLFKK